MSAVPQQRGQLRVITCPDCEKKDRKLENAIRDLENAEIALRSERAKAKRWKAMLDDKQKQHKDFQTVERLFHWWQDCTGHDKANLDAVRIQKCLTALKRYTERELAVAIKGNAVNGFRDPRTGVKYDSFGQVLGNSDNIEKNISRWQAYCEQNNIRFDTGPTRAELKAQEKSERLSTVRLSADNPVHADGSSRPEG